MKTAMKAAQLLLLACICTILLTACGEKNIDLLNYATVDVTGIDGKAKAHLEVDWDTLCNDIYAEGKDQTETNLFQNEIDLQTNVDFRLDKTSDLSNGDKVTLTVVFSDEYMKSHKLSCKETTKEYPVSGLDEFIAVDPFDPAFFHEGSPDNNEKGVYVYFEGIAPDTNVVISNTLTYDDAQRYVDYTADKETCSKGDVITISATLSGAGAEKGYKLTSETTQITCSEVDEYLTSLDQLTVDDWEEIKAGSMELREEDLDPESSSMPHISIDDYDYEARAPYDEVSNFGFEKATLQLSNELPNPDIFNGCNNRLMIRFHVDVVKDGTSYNNCVGFYKFDNLIKRADGTVEMENPYRGYLYTDDEHFLENNVTRYEDKYTFYDMALTW